MPDIEFLRKAQSYLGLIAKLSNRESTAKNIAKRRRSACS